MDCSYFNRFFHRLFVSIEIKNVDAKHEKAKRKNIFLTVLTFVFYEKLMNSVDQWLVFYHTHKNQMVKKKTNNHPHMNVTNLLCFN